MERWMIQESPCSVRWLLLLLLLRISAGNMWRPLSGTGKYSVASRSLPTVALVADYWSPFRLRGIPTAGWKLDCPQANVKLLHIAITLRRPSIGTALAIWNSEQPLKVIPKYANRTAM